MVTRVKGSVSPDASEVPYTDPAETPTTVEAALDSALGGAFDISGNAATADLADDSLLLSGQTLAYVLDSTNHTNVSGSATPIMLAHHADGTWTKPAGLVSIKITVIGGGGGQGGKESGETGIGGNGGEGGTAIKYVAAADLGSTEPVTVGSGGAKGNDNVGGGISGADGGDSLFGTHSTGTGGEGGNGASQSSNGADGANGNGISGNFNLAGSAYNSVHGVGGAGNGSAGVVLVEEFF